MSAPSVLEAAPEPNLPLLRKVLAHIDAHPEEWNQRMYATRTECQTAYCIAGHVAAMYGEVVGWIPLLDGTEYAAVVRTADGEGLIGEFAERLLGLTPEEGRQGLFAESNTREDVQRIAEQIASRAGQVL